jgi:pyruvate ferredoxin oxidoreductase gamma subunit
VHNLKEIRLHGRGGQGAVLAAELLAVAAFEDGQYGQAFPLFGGERRGAPVQAFVRLDHRPIRLRYRVTEPDYVIILDRTLPETVDVLAGLKPGGIVLLDAEGAAGSLRWTADASVYTVPGTRIALDVFGQPLVNPAMLGAFAAVAGEVSLAAIQQAFRSRFPGPLGEKNCHAAQLGYDWAAGPGHAATNVTRAGPFVAPVPGWEGSEGLGAPGRPLHFAAIVAPRTSLAYRTGAWRYQRPLLDPARCNGCGVCVTFCPEGCVSIVERCAILDYVYCKGCGICAEECARAAIQMAAEE